MNSGNGGVGKLADWYGTNREGSEGEGLSRFLAARFLTINGLGYPPSGFANINIWMSSARNGLLGAE
jgi:hypothetical protein